MADVTMQDRTESRSRCDWRRAGTSELWKLAVAGGILCDWVKASEVVSAGAKFPVFISGDGDKELK